MVSICLLLYRAMNRLIQGSVSLSRHMGGLAPKYLLSLPTFRAPLHVATLHSCAISGTGRADLMAPYALLQKSVPASIPFSLNSIRLGSTLKKRSDKMNKHKLKKRRKSLRFNTKASRGKVR